MSEVLVHFSEPVVDQRGVAYSAQACGRVGDDQLWEGWLEFIPLTEAGEPLRTSRETTQPNRTDLAYWASGLTMIYLEGALQRAKSPTHIVHRVTVDAEPFHDGPAPAVYADSVEMPRAVLNPFAVYVQGEKVLRQELTALDPMHLRNILGAYAPEGAPGPGASGAEMRERIVALAREGVTGRTGFEEQPRVP
jgi:hypothetical protein